MNQTDKAIHDAAGLLMRLADIIEKDYEVYLRLGSHLFQESEVKRVRDAILLVEARRGMAGRVIRGDAV